MVGLWIVVLILVNVDSANAGATCPGDLYYYAETISDNREFYSRVKAGNIDDCARKCYADDFCFSAHFTPKPPTADADCRLSYIAAYNCTRKKLVSTLNDPNRVITIECLRCPQLGEHISAPPVPGFGEEPAIPTVASLPEASRPAELLSTPSINANYSSTTLPTNVTTTSSPPNAVASVASLPEATTPAELPSTQSRNETTGISSTAPTASSPGTVVSAEPISNISAVNSTLSSITPSNTSILETTTSVTSILSSLISTLITTVAPTLAANTTPSSYTPIIGSNVSTGVTIEGIANVTHAAEIDQSAAQITKSPIQQTVPPNGEIKSTIASSQFPENQTSIQPGTPESLLNITETSPTPGNITEANPTPANINVSTNASPEIGNTGQERRCESGLTFELRIPDPVAQKSLNAMEQVIASTANQCAELCYAKNCTTAGYVPPAQNEAGSCLLVYVESIEVESCGRTNNRTSSYNGTDVVEIHCIKCEAAENIEPAPAVITKLPEQETFTISPSTVEQPANATPAGPVENHEIGPIISQVQTCRETVTFIISQPISNETVSFSNYSDASSAAECARRCYETGCSVAGYTPANPGLNVTNGSCLLSFGEKKCDEGGIQVSTDDTSKPVRIDCVKCEDEGASASSSSLVTPAINTSLVENVTESLSTLPTFTTLLTSPPTSPICSDIKRLTFSVRPPSNPRPTFSNGGPAGDVHECAKICFEKRCTLASYLAAALPNSVGTCLYSFESNQQCGADQRKVSAYNGPYPVDIYCVRCGEESLVETPATITKKQLEENVTLAPVGNITSSSNATTSANIIETGLSTNVTAVPGTAAKSCPSGLSFQIISPDPNRSVNFTTDRVYIESLTECVGQCYQRNCMIAGYLPGGKDKFPNGNCLFSFDAPIRNECKAGKRVTDYTAEGPVQIQCVVCNANSLAEQPLVINKPSLNRIIAGNVTGEKEPIVSIPNATVSTWRNDLSTSISTSIASSTKSDKTLTAPACTISFQVTDPTNAKSDIKFHNETSGLSLYECLNRCYFDGCSVAGYTPARGATPSVCKESFNRELCTDSHKITTYQENKPIWMHCLRCDERLPNGTSTSTVASSTLLEPSTIIPKQNNFSSSLVAVSGSSQGVPKINGANSTLDIESNIDNGVDTALKPDETAQGGIVSNTKSPWNTSDVRHCTSSLSYIVSPSRNGPPRLVNRSTVVTNVEQCALECFAHNCTQATYHPQGFHLSEFGTKEGILCYLSLEPAVCPAEHEQFRVSNYSANEPTLITCIQCGDYKRGNGEQSPLSGNLTNSTSPIPTSDSSPTPLCPTDQLSFEWRRPSATSSKNVNYTDEAQVSSAEECAQLCHSRACVTAGYSPSSGIDPSACLLAFDGDAQCGRGNVSSEYTGDGIIEIGCTRCGPQGALVIEEAPSAVTKSGQSIDTNQTSTPISTSSVTPITEPESTTELVPVRRCIGELKFVATPAEVFVNVSKAIFVKSDKECAEECYAHGCVQALYNEGELVTDGYPCLLSLDPFDCSRDIKKVNHTNSSQVVSISCVECSLTGPVLVASNESEANKTSEIGEAAIDDSPSQVTKDATATLLWSTISAGTVGPTSTPRKDLKEEMRTCSGTISFQVLTNEPLQIPIAISKMVSTADECALFCYNDTQCTAADFVQIPSTNDTKQNQCHLSYSAFQTCDPTLQSVTSLDEASVNETRMRIKCVRCTDGNIESRPDVKSARAYSAGPINTTAALYNYSSTPAPSPTPASLNISRTNRSSSCSDELTFQIISPLGATLAEYQSDSHVNSFIECVYACYNSSCTRASFVPPTAPGQTGICLMAFSEEKCDPNEPRVTNYTGDEIRLIECIRCSAENESSLNLTAASNESSSNNETAYPYLNVTTPNSDISNSSTINESSIAHAIDGPPEAAAGGADVLVDELNSDRNWADSSSTQYHTSQSPANGTQAPAMEFHWKPSGRVANAEREECSSRLTFQVLETEYTFKSNFTEDHRVGSAADCARLCYNTSYCQVAGYLPPPENIRDGICLISNITGQCSSNATDMVQVYKTVPFIITCIKCSPCSFNLRSALIPPFPNYTDQTDARSIVDCARNCAQRNCTRAAFSSRASSGNCLLSIGGAENCQSEAETRVEPWGPVQIDCVRCNKS